MNSLIKEIEKLKQLNKIKDSYIDQSPIYLYGMTDASKAHILLALFDMIQKNMVIVFENDRKAKEFLSEINSISPNTAKLFPTLDINFYNIKSLEDKNENLRLECIDSLIKNEKFIMLTSLDAMTNKLTKKDLYLDMRLKIDYSSAINIDDLKNSLIKLSYDKVKLVEFKGQFSIRGSIIDIWPISYDNPVRIELFDTEIDSIRLFDKDTQRSIGKLDEVEIYPISELIYQKEDFDLVIKNIDKDIKKLEKKDDSFKNKQKLIDKYMQIIAYINNNLYIANKDLITAYRKKNFDSIMDYLPKDSLLVTDDISRILDKTKESDEKFSLDLSNQMDNGEVFNTFKNLRISYKDILNEFESFSILNVSSILKRIKKFSPKILVELKTLEIENFNKNISRFIENLKKESEKKSKQIILSGGNESKTRIIRAFKDNLLDNYIIDEEKELEKGDISVSVANSSEGYYVDDLDLFVYSHKEIFGKERFSKKQRSTKKLTNKDIINYSDLEIGDYVVHENNGIGIYQGIKKIEVNSIVKDYLVIEYKGSDKLFVPIDQMNLVNKYIGNKSEKPKISSLGGNQWSNAKIRARKAVDEIAEDLIELYAKRANAKGHAFSKDTPWQSEFEDSFVYEETLSQIRSIEEIKKDMEEEKPMDRLLCGDVGYGKTEVALRAAFKAINDGYQVAFLVPTTILARQHYDTIKSRFENFPVESAMLSRFTSKKDEKKALQGLKAGNVDIVVGTHRILSKDVEFNKLGLLIIDEEQRFGVKHKEKLKNLKENIDVLTLSATPIPRTLQMSLTGIRDMSTLDQPPEERQPVNTYVMEYDDLIIKEAIEKELNRGGQVYFVYNRVFDIENIYNKIKSIVPYASIEIAHGQKTSKDLERIMDDFVNGDIDILLSTTIIETGMDIQNVNTIIVYDSDMMGLSQLYQLKGRIGRSHRSSYAYFTYKKGKVLTEIGEKRLKSIKDFSDFGSGYKIAMRDLELRGAGNILGESQSGHVESVGYDLYVKFLQQAVDKASGKESVEKEFSDIYIDIKIDAYIPSYYIEDSSQKIEIYNRIAKIKDMQDYDILVEDLIDRYGDIPVMVDNIMYVSLIKSLADELGFYEIRERKGMIYLFYEQRDKYSFEELSFINENYNGNLSFDLSNKPSFKIKIENNKLLDCYELLKTIKKVREKEWTKN